MNTEFGKVFNIMRTQKNIKLKEITCEELSIYTLSRFENGKTVLAADKFYTALRRIFVRPEEFDVFYRHYSLSEDNFFSFDYSEAYAKRDITSLQHYLSIANQFYANETESYFWRINCLMLRGMIFSLHNDPNDRNVEPLQDKDITFLKNYLDDAKIFSAYEIWLIMASASFLDYDFTLRYAQKIMQISNTFAKDRDVRRNAIQAILNTLSLATGRAHSAEDAIKLISFLDTFQIPAQDVLQRGCLKFSKGAYLTMIGQIEKGVEQMEAVVHALKEMDAHEFYQVLKADLDTRKALLNH